MRGRTLNEAFIILDEAQNLSPMRLEELRLLTNLNVERRLVLQLLLVGQPELRDALRAPGLRQFVQRISVDYHLGPLDDQDAQAYVRHRLATAGGVEALIEEAAVAEAQAASGGIPRLINQLCAMALVYAYASGAACVDRSTMLRVIRDRLEGGLFPVTAAAGARREYVPAPLEPSCH
jgi:type II secretory pathway predicted ATPase ExeA